MKTAQTIVEETKRHIDERFKSLIDNKIVKAASIANVHNWPEESELLDVYGEEVDELFTHFKEPLEKRHIDSNRAKVQWIDLKKFVTRHRKLQKDQQKQQSFKWKTILTDSELRERFHHILVLL